MTDDDPIAADLRRLAQEAPNTFKALAEYALGQKAAPTSGPVADAIRDLKAKGQTDEDIRTKVVRVSAELIAERLKS